MTGLTLAQLDAGILTLKARLASRASSSTHPGGRSLTAGDVRERARLYLGTIPGAVAGQHGHDRTFYAAGKLVRGFALDHEAAYALLAEWNQKCEPPWSEHDLRRKLEQAARQPGPRGTLLTSDPLPPGGHTGKTGKPAEAFRNWKWDEKPEGDTMRRFKAGRRGPELVEELVAYTGGWPRRVGSMLFAKDRAGGIIWMKSVSELFAWIDWQYSFGDGRGFDWTGASDALTKEDFLAACRQHCEHWDQVELYPHEPQLANHYYHHPEVTPGDGKTLSDLVQRFYPDTTEDEDLIRLFFLTLVWGGPPRKRPIFVFESAAKAAKQGRGAGKTTVPIFGSQLVGGFLSVSPKEQLRDIHARFLSPTGLVKRIALIDNLKSLRFSDSDLEGLVTIHPISGRQMYTGEGSRPNTIVWVVTSNKPSLSKDLAQRSVIIRVTTPVYTPEWERDMGAFIETHRWQIIGDCVAELKQASRLPADFVFSRWAEWEREVLGTAPDPASLARALAERQQLVDDDDEIAGTVADAICELLKGKRFDPDRDAVLIPSQVLVDEVVNRYAERKMTPTSGMRWLYMLGISNLSKNETGTPYRGAIWRPADCPTDRTPLTWADRLGIGGLPD